MKLVNVKFNFFVLAASIGGQMGVFLGASVLTLSELMEVMFMSLVVLCKKIVRPRRLAPITVGEVEKQR